MSDELDFKWAKKRIQDCFGPPIGQGRHRVVFHDKRTNTVLKVPIAYSGVHANEHEGSISGDIYAKCSIDKVMSDIAGGSRR